MSDIVSIHGHGLRLEDGDRGHVDYRAWGAAYRSDTEELNFLHAAIPTPHTINESRVRASRAYLRFRLYDPDPNPVALATAEIVSIGFWDGQRRIAKLDELGIDHQSLGTEWQTRFFDVPGSDPLEYGFGMSIGVKALYWSVTIGSAGCEFTTL